MTNRTYVRYSTGVLRQDLKSLKERVREERTEIRHGLEAAQATLGSAERERLRWIRRADRAELWRGDGSRSMAEWLAARLHVGQWKARRMVAAAHALERLPFVATALSSGALSLDKVVELSRFATPETEKKLVRWAQRVSTGAVRDRADGETARPISEVERDHRARSMEWLKVEGGFNMMGFLPTDQGEALIEEVDDLAHQLPKSPEAANDPCPDDEWTMSERRADAIVLLATRGGPDKPGRATVVLHTTVDELAGNDRSPTTERGGCLHPETARRLACDARLQIVLKNGEGKPLGIGERSQIAPPWLRRAVFQRDGHCCTFPGCEMRRFLTPHHIVHWSRGGATDFDNLVTVCSFHHTLVHEQRWGVKLEDDVAIWFDPGGRMYEPGRAPPEIAAIGPPDRARLAEAVPYSKLFALVGVA